MRPLLACGLASLLATAGVAGAADEHRLIFVSRRSGENLLYVARPDGGGARPIFGGALQDVPGVGAGLAIHREPHWCRQSPDGRFFLDWAADIGFPREKYNSPAHFLLYLGRIDDGKARVLAADAGESFAWSPDSRRVAFSTYAVKEPYGLGGLAARAPSTRVVVVDADGSNEGLVLERPGLWNVLDWSPDGRRLLIDHLTGHSPQYDYDGLVELDLAALTRRLAQLAKSDRTLGQLYPGLGQGDAHLRLLTGAAKVSDGRYSPDGKSVACLFQPEDAPETPRFELGLLDPATRRIRPIHAAPGLRGPICWSPDGREILFSRTLEPQHAAAEEVDGRVGLGIYAAQADGTGARFVTSGWSPDLR